MPLWPKCAQCAARAYSVRRSSDAKHNFSTARQASDRNRAGSGIGRASAQLFAAEGARVLAADNNAAAVARTVAAITEAGGIALAAEADAAAEDNVVLGAGSTSFFCQRRHQWRSDPPLRAAARVVAGGTARQPDRAVPRDQ